MIDRLPEGWRQLAVANDYYTRNVYRNGDVIHKDASAWTPTVHALLEHLEKRSFPAPRVVGTGFDEDGRETISYVDGEVLDSGPWSDQAVTEVGRMLRCLHEATPWDAAIREVHEETGLTVTIERLVGIYSKPGRNGITLCFESIVTDGALQVSDEADEHRYFALEHLPRRLSPNQREYIQDWTSETTPAMRRQDGVPTREWLKTLG